jgi:hypothetical protein
MLTAEVRARVAPLFAAAARLSSATDPAARAARQRLAESSGLSPQGVELALALSLEKDASDAELAALASSVPRAPGAHVLLSANVFVATQRALALALVAAPRVCVRASRREPEMARFYAEAAPGLFEIVDELRPEPGDVVFAYGGAEALASVVPASIGAGAGVRAYGPGFGLEICEERAVETEPQRSELARAVALDAVLFDQRGCLSPRLILFQGERASACRFAEALCAELESFARGVPLGRVDGAELAEIRRYGETMIYAGELFTSAAGAVGVAAFDAPTSLSPVGRTLHVIPVSDAARRARELADGVTTVAVAGGAELLATITQALPEARVTVPGWLQRPAFDGPVDRRAAR